MREMFTPYQEVNFRPDIQGIRAIGALTIMAYHIWLNKVSGGVDVFFVISGYFMGKVLLRQLAMEQRIRPFVFWSKIVTRIAPSVYIVLLATLVLAYFFVPATQWTRLLDEVISSAFHLENFYLMHASVDYLARTEPPSAVQQFWAMSIQMQFYLLLPFAFMVGTALSTMARRIYPLPLLIGLGIVMSFAYSIYITSRIPNAAYFNPLARAWEFGAGILLAMLLPYVKAGLRVREILALAGISTLLLLGLLTPKTVPYPGCIALIPVGAAACLILGGGIGLTSTRVNRLLSHPCIVRLGDNAFGIYLWHWPLLVFYLEIYDRKIGTLTGGLVIMALAIGLAALTKRWVEEPLRRHRTERRYNVRVSYLVGALFLIPPATLAGAIKLHFESVADAYSHSLPATFSSFKIQQQQDATTIPYNEFLVVKDSKPASYTDNCHQSTAVATISICEYGDTKASTSVALVGGSHATQWLPALDTIGKKLGLQVLNITKSHCPFGALPESHESCHLWNKQVIAYLINAQPLLVITNSTRASTTERDEYVPSSYADQWLALAAYNISVVGIRDNPQFSFDAAHCVARNRSAPLNCAKPRLDALNDRDPAEALVLELSNLRLVDMTDYLCMEHTCPTVTQNRLMYRDDEHLSVSYVNALAPALQQKLAEVAPAAFSGAGTLASTQLP